MTPPAGAGRGRGGFKGRHRGKPHTDRHRRARGMTGSDLARLHRFIYPTASARKLRLFACSTCRILRSSFTATLRTRCSRHVAEDGTGRSPAAPSLRAPVGQPDGTETGASAGHRYKPCPPGVALAAADLATRPRKDVVSGEGRHALYAEPSDGAGGERRPWVARSGPSRAAPRHLRQPVPPRRLRPGVAHRHRRRHSPGRCTSPATSPRCRSWPTRCRTPGATATTSSTTAAATGPHVRGCWVVDLVLGKA